METCKKKIQEIEQEQYQNLLKRRCNDVKKEVKRLKQLEGILSQEVMSRYALHSFSQESRTMMMVGRCLEIKHLYRTSHYTFFHGQGAYMSVVVDFIEELRKKELEQKLSKVQPEKKLQK